MKEIFEEIRQERQKQTVKWGDNELDQSQEKFLTILAEEFGEVARAVLEKDKEGYRKELIQVAAVCVKMIQSFDKGNN